MTRQVWEENPFVQSNDSFLEYVNGLREKFAIRVEVINRTDDLSIVTESTEETALGKALAAYLFARLPESSYQVQRTNVSRYHYVWFMNKDDALAFMLKWNGRIV